MKGKPLRLKGQRFGRLVVVEQYRTTCFCLCDCLNSMQTEAARLSFGHTRSCGCLQKEATRQNNETGRSGWGLYWSRKRAKPEQQCA
jgi:hypothetical protein